MAADIVALTKKMIAASTTEEKLAIKAQIEAATTSMVAQNKASGEKLVARIDRNLNGGRAAARRRGARR